MVLNWKVRKNENSPSHPFPQAQISFQQATKVAFPVHPGFSIFKQICVFSLTSLTHTYMHTYKWEHSLHCFELYLATKYYILKLFLFSYLKTFLIFLWFMIVTDLVRLLFDKSIVYGYAGACFLLYALQIVLQWIC